MGVQVAFNYGQFLSMFPELAYINAGASFTGAINGNTLTATAVTFGSLAVGQLLQDTTGALLPWTTIAAVINAPAGTYSVTTAQTLAAEPMTTLGNVQAAFAEAELIQNNTGLGPPCDTTEQSGLMNLLTAHIAVLNSPGPNGASSGLVGRIANATQGSVTVGTQFDMPPGSAQWFAQTKYGAAYWQATSVYRRMRHWPSPGRVAAWAGPGVGVGLPTWGTGLTNGGPGPRGFRGF